MEIITKTQFDNLITQKTEILDLPKHILDDIKSLRKCTKNGKAHLLLTHPHDQNEYYLEYVEVDELCDEEIAETQLRAKENRGHFIAI